MATTDATETREPADEAADLYDGDEHLGSLLDLGSLADLLDDLVPDGGEGGEDEYRRTVARLVKRGGVTGWPWSTPDSTATPWAYVYRARSVQVYRAGRLLAVLYPGHARPRARPARSNPFPTMIEPTESDENAES